MVQDVKGENDILEQIFESELNFSWKEDVLVEDLKHFNEDLAYFFRPFALPLPFVTEYFFIYFKLILLIGESSCHQVLHFFIYVNFIHQQSVRLWELLLFFYEGISPIFH